MNWLTTDQIKKAAKKSRKAALECSREHWRQLSEATAEELRTGVSRGLVSLTDAHCAMCIRHWKCGWCGTCPLYEAGHGCNGNESLWRTAEEALRYAVDNTGRSSWSAWKRAAKAMYKKLCEVK